MSWDEEVAEPAHAERALRVRRTAKRRFMALLDTTTGSLDCRLQIADLKGGPDTLNLQSAICNLQSAIPNTA